MLSPDGGSSETLAAGIVTSCDIEARELSSQTPHDVQCDEHEAEFHFSLTKKNGNREG